MLKEADNDTRGHLAQADYHVWKKYHKFPAGWTTCVILVVAVLWISLTLLLSSPTRPFPGPIAEPRKKKKLSSLLRLRN